MSNIKHSLFALSIFLFFVIIASLPIALLFNQFNIISIIFFTIYTSYAIGISFKLMELTLSFFWTPLKVPMHNQPISNSSIAIVMTVCDDLNSRALNELNKLAKNGYDSFLLDDSTNPISLSTIQQFNIQVVRRIDKIGAKAGNLNHWFNIYGQEYEFVCVLDSDSFIPLKALQDLGKAAACKENWDVAIFQAKIVENPNHEPTLQAVLTGIGSSARMSLLERVHSRLNMIVSHGHNQLIRISALLEIGGFDEGSCHEDVVLTFELNKNGWRTVMVDTITYDEEPSTYEAYCRRTIRWARQTVEVFRRPWRNVSIELKLLMGQWLLAYITPFLVLCHVYLVLLSNFTDSPEIVIYYTTSVWLFKFGFEKISIAWWTGFGIFLLTHTLIFIHNRLNGDKGKHIILAWLYSYFAMSTLALPLVVFMSASAIGYSTNFIPTNIKTTWAHKQRWMYRFIQYCGVLVYFLFIIAIYNKPENLLLGLTILWVFLICMSPLIFLKILLQHHYKKS